MFLPDIFIQLSELNQRNIAAAVRIAAAIAKTGHGINEKSARGVLKCDDVAWADFKLTLRPFFKWQSGRIDLIINPEDRPLSFELLTEEDKRKIEAQDGRRAALDAATTKAVQNLGTFTPASAKIFYFQLTRLYGPKASTSARCRRTGKPGNPKASSSPLSRARRRPQDRTPQRSLRKDRSRPETRRWPNGESAPKAVIAALIADRCYP